ncbi:MAG: hypothetical protein OXC31_05805 [Spirochaetaceae bacterium]|nr:hypothetical protein [Spirochaetaceae bacterium]
MAEAGEPHRQRRGQLELVTPLHLGGEPLGMGDARADVGAQALRAVVADDEPELERAKAAAEGHVPGAGQRGLLRRGAFDHDFALRILLSAMFGKRALQPFRLFWSERRRCGSLYAYGDADHGALQRTLPTIIAKSK